LIWTIVNKLPRLRGERGVVMRDYRFERGVSWLNLMTERGSRLVRIRMRIRFFGMFPLFSDWWKETDKQARDIERFDRQDPLESPLGGIIGSSEKGGRCRFCLCHSFAKRDKEGCPESRFDHQSKVEKISKWNTEKYEWFEEEREGQIGQ
jgi:hypothetical protein